jgi:hypothetical protein
VIDFHAALSGHDDWFKDHVHPGGDGPKVIAATAYKAITGQDAPEIPAKAPKASTKPAK